MFALGAAGPSGISVVVQTFAILCSTAGPVCLSEGAYNGGGAGAAVPLPLLPTDWQCRRGGPIGRNE